MEFTNDYFVTVHLLNLQIRLNISVKIKNYFAEMVLILKYGGYFYLSFHYFLKGCF